MTIEKLWESACCGENDKLKEYYENGGKINRRYRMSIIMMMTENCRQKLIYLKE